MERPAIIHHRSTVPRVGRARGLAAGVDLASRQGDTGQPSRGARERLNHQNDAAVLNFRTISGSRYNEILAILNPRVFRADLRLEF